MFRISLNIVGVLAFTPLVASDLIRLDIMWISENKLAEFESEACYYLEIAGTGLVVVSLFWYWFGAISFRLPRWSLSTWDPRKGFMGINCLELMVMLVKGLNKWGLQRDSILASFSIHTIRSHAQVNWFKQLHSLHMDWDMKHQRPQTSYYGNMGIIFP